VIVAKRAATPTNPVIAQPVRNAATGVALGLVLGTVVALIRDRVDNTIQDSEAVEEITGASLVGSIPFDQRLQKSPCIAFDSDQSSIAEAFRALRTNLRFLKVDNPPRVLIVTCCHAEEGKSLTAVNLALTLAQSGKNVVIVDGDLRRPSLHNLLGLDDSVGFSNVLSGQHTLDEALQQTQFAGLSALTAGIVPPNPGELLESSADQDLLTELRSRFDYVIVDSSPLLAVTDAAILAASSDGVLMVCRFAVTRRDQLTQAVRRLEKVGARVHGAIFTMVPARRDDSQRRYLRYAGKTASKIE
jgi:receptor protein-tyrosine kinase